MIAGSFRRAGMYSFVGRSSDKASFDQAAPPYQKALDESGYHYTLQYEPTKASKRKNRQRNNILWYNPPFSKNTSTNIGHKFLALVDKHFPKDHKLRKIFNRNTIKISYSCMNNTKQIIDNHNKRILTAPIQIDDTATAAAATIDNNKTCNLCLKEKFLIICRPELSTLNKRNELVSSCRHRNKALLRNN